MNFKLFGSALILSGTALGAGMLAIPMVLAQFGLFYSTLLMLVICAGTTYSALLLTEACSKTELAFGINTVANRTLGKGGQVITNALFYLLLICMLIAYILGAADLLKRILAIFDIEMSIEVAQIGFTLVASMFVVCGTQIIDKLNRVLFLFMISMLAITLIILVPGISVDNLTQVTNTDKGMLFGTSTILFTSFASMPVIPSLVAYNKEASRQQLRNMIILGSVIPLICYLVWLYAVVGNLNADDITHFSNISDLIQTFSAKNEYIEIILSIFTSLALLTSFLGVAMALYNQNKDMISHNKVVTYVCTFVLPLLGASLAADQFLSVLGYAGVILVFLAIFIPLAMVVSLRKKKGNDNETSAHIYEAEGGHVALGLTLLFGFLLLVSQVL
ncbi:tyrosine transporter [Aliivibrio finisterrensis]|uniref:Tyrosine transporter n=1 Tax=Aliivibrio finisterrensis TaxID=511998 RepID=A0A4Q5KND0_9GAMM|nr:MULTISPECIES: aromatic amino acid transport family protein [Aliivibrio]MDD9173686.1 aromatic amino acid transport family protein [Aliivibrio sp. S3TY1]MDD9190762.1 aromatic amino acid transport family protein [Aliivibrio sp. S2TY2]RYU46991.1 tyrosine transporter [Aliivibrio finisterrensis]